MAKEFRRSDWLVPVHPTAGTTFPREEMPDAEAGDRLVVEYPGGLELTALCIGVEVEIDRQGERSEWVSFNFDPPLDQQGLPEGTEFTN